MAVQRFLPDVERTRRTAGLVFIAVGVFAVAWLCWSAIAAGRFNLTTLFLIALAAALAAWGLRLALRHAVVVEVDLDRRTYAVIRDGRPGGSGPLDALGPLAVSKRTRVSGGSGNRRTVVEYVVSPAAHSKIDLHVRDTSGKARQKMEALARAWRLPCRSLGGALRAAGALDEPLHERLRGDQQAAVAAPLRPEWGLRIELLPAGHAIVSTHRSWAPLSRSALLALAPLVVLGAAASTGLVSTLREASGDLLERVLLGLMGVAGLSLLWTLWRGARDTLFPGTVRVTEGGVSHRGTRMPFGEIEEVTAGLPIEVVGDRRILTLPASFCPEAAAGAVAHELQRLILEIAPRRPLPVR